LSSYSICMNFVAAIGSSLKTLGPWIDH
jgi:hypothetical protein